MAATQAQVNTIVANIIATIPAHSAISTQTITSQTTAFLSALDSEVVAANNKAAQLAETNAISAKVKQH